MDLGIPAARPSSARRAAGSAAPAPRARRGRLRGRGQRPSMPSALDATAADIRKRDRRQGHAVRPTSPRRRARPRCSPPAPSRTS